MSTLDLYFSSINIMVTKSAINLARQQWQTLPLSAQFITSLWSNAATVCPNMMMSDMYSVAQNIIMLDSFIAQVCVQTVHFDDMVLW